MTIVYPILGDGTPQNRSAAPGGLCGSWALFRAALSSPAVLWLLISLVPGTEVIALAQETADGSNARQAVIVVVGAEGTAEYGRQFRIWAQRWHEAAVRGQCDVRLIGMDVQDSSLLVPDNTASDAASSAKADSAGSPPIDGGTESAASHDQGNESVAGISDREQLRHAFSELGQQSVTEPLYVVLIGHGTFDTRSSRFSLRGPDISAAELADDCSRIRRPLAIINCSSSSAPFINELSGSDRVVICATKDAGQLQYSRFGDAMSAAIGSLDADIDRDGQTSLLEAWLYASRRTAEFYSSEGRLATEHALLDDNGDQRGTRAELYDGYRPRDDAEPGLAIDGALAARWHLIRSAEEQRLTPEERTERDRLEGELERLRHQRKQLPETEYLEQLEQILVPLARIYEAADSR